jgi:hypothetical protein
MRVGSSPAVAIGERYWRAMFAEALGVDEQQLTAIRERGSEAGATPHNPDHAAGV